MSTTPRTSCRLCPRACGDRGRCGVPRELAVARTGLHFDEEPCLSGTRGSGAIFFAGCNLGCVFCQNAEISRAPRAYRVMTERELADTFRALEDAGAHNINLVTPSHYADRILSALRLYRPRVPVVWNSSGYDRPRTVAALAEYVSVWLPDLKFRSAQLSARLCGAPDYFDVAIQAIDAMRARAPRAIYAADGTLAAGIVVRHLVLPGHNDDSLAVIEAIAEMNPPPLLSLMNQYLPCGRAAEYPEINRRLTTYEYRKVLARARALGLQGFAQERAAADVRYIPRWNEFIR